MAKVSDWNIFYLEGDQKVAQELTREIEKRLLDIAAEIYGKCETDNLSISDESKAAILNYFKEIMLI
jgi:hypothetical protein